METAQGREEDNGIMGEWEIRWGKVEKACTHLAASKSSSFLYSPKWLQKIMVSEANRMKDVQQQQEARVTKEQRTAGSPTQTHSNTHRHQCTNAALLFSRSLPVSLFWWWRRRAPTPLAWWNSDVEQIVDAASAVSWIRRTNWRISLLTPQIKWLSFSGRKTAHTHIQTHTPLPLNTVSPMILPLHCQFYVCIGGAVTVITQDKRKGGNM